MKGFSLIEALITLVIFSLIFIAMFSIMNQGLKTWHIADINIEVQQDARRAVMAMERQLHQTRTSQIAQPANGTYYTTLSFKLPQDTDGDGDLINSTGNIEWSNFITYSRNGSNQLIRTNSDGSISVLAQNITNLQFRRYSGNPKVIEITITARKATAADKSSQVNIISLVKVRN